MSARFDTFHWLPREGEAIWDYWLSLSPMAPVFGVPWRFGDLQAVPDPKPAPTQSPTQSPTLAEAEDTVVMPAPVVPPVAEPVAATAAPEELAPAPLAEEPPTPSVDDLSLIKGVGPKMVEKLHAAGITSFAQIAAWDEAKIAEMGALLGGLPGAITRADWVGQAKDLR